jgi:uncharacterized SAM-binding protein YcdF (DUF218 family)
VAALARREGWRRVIVVTDPFHSRRAAGALRREGLKVRSVPCGHGEYRSERLDSPDDRIEAFRDWLHETMAIRYYRSRGWL